MLSSTLQTGLEQYGIGTRIRALRLRKKMGLVELGRHTGLSAALLSKLERGRLFPTLPTLLRIALVFGVGLDYFFAGAREKPLAAIVRKRDRVRLPDQPGARKPAYRFESLDFEATERRFNSFLAEFIASSAEEVRPHAHPGVEFIHVLTGRLVVQLEADEHELAAGDAMYFDSSRSHGYRRAGAHPCTAFVVTAP